MANAHVYGIRYFRSISGNETPQILTFPIVTAYQPNPVFGTSDASNVNLNIGDPISLLATGGIALTQEGADVAGANTDLVGTGIRDRRVIACSNRTRQDFIPDPGNIGRHGMLHAVVAFQVMCIRIDTQ